MIGRTLGHYSVTARLGAGGMGEVYRARDGRLGRDVALKVLPASRDVTPEHLARFEREARTVAGLNHPNIVTLFSIEEADGVRFITMELVEGSGLDALVTPGGLPVVKILEIAIPLADALAAAHESGVIHRDLKPGNVMIARDGRVKVLDFGLAKLAQPGGDLDVTQAATAMEPVSVVGQLLGTVPYMAPEQVRGETVDARADLFAFGIMLYELATGSRPFGGSTPADVTSSILRDAPAPLERTRADLPRGLDVIVRRCLEKDRTARYASARDIVTALKALGRPLAAAPKPPSETPSIAILPFANRSRDEEDEYFSDGLADELLSVLAKIKGLRVAARTSSGSFKGKDVTIADVGRALNVATVLEGSVRKAGNRVRIAVQLVKVADGYPLWSEVYDRTLDDIFAVQDDIAQSVVKELRTTLLGESADSNASGAAKAEVAAAAQGRGHNAEAHRLYLQGRHFIDRLTEEDNARGIRYLKDGLKLDPHHALAWVALTDAHLNMAGWGWTSPVEGHRLAREAIDRALELAPDLAEAQNVLSRLLRMARDWAGASVATARALELAPDSAETLRAAGVLARQLNRLDEAEDFLRRALEQDPLSSVTASHLGYVYRSMGRNAEAMAMYRKALEIAPGRVSTHHTISVLLTDEGRLEEALEEAMMEPGEWARLTSLVYVHHFAGRPAEAEAALSELTEKHARDSGIQLAACHAVMGHRDEAFSWLDTAWAELDGGLGDIQCEPNFRSLHGDPRWAALLERVGFSKAG